MMIYVLYGILIFAAIMAFRNYWVFEKMTGLNRFENGVHIIKLYEDYDTMMLKFWIWDVEKFRK